MTLPTVSQILPGMAHVTGVGFLAYLTADALGSNGIVGLIAGAVVALIVEGLRTMAMLRKEKREAGKQRTDGAILIDQERDRIADRADRVHQQEVTMLNQLHAREMESLRHSTATEKEFLQRQVTYHESLELVGRKRLHAMVGEVQRCVMYIRTTEALMREHRLTPEAFKLKSFEDILELYPLPEEPAAPKQ
jgi:hypothetical protein